MRHPIQPLEIDNNGTLRFKENKIVRYLLDNGGIDMNEIARQQFPKEEQEHFAQLIGYSLGGAGELDYFSDQTYMAAQHMYEKRIDEQTARIAYLEDTIKEIKDGLRSIVPAVFHIHPDDLGD